MPVNIDFALARSEDGTLTVAVAPPTNISGWSIEYAMTRRLGGTVIDYRCAASGYNNVSGINVTDGAKGVLQVTLPATAMSGYDAGNYAYQVRRNSSGTLTVLTQGYRLAE